MLEHLIARILPTIISLCELIGIFVVIISSIQAFIQYLREQFTRKRTNFKFELARGLASGLEFKMAAEILKTVQVRDFGELTVLAIVIALRALLSFLIHFEMKHGREKHASVTKEEAHF